MAEQPTWRGHRAPVEDPTRPGVAVGGDGRRRSRWWALLGLLAALAVVGGCTALVVQLTKDDPSPLPTITAGTCLTSADLARGTTTLDDLDAVSCGRLHDAEVFALLALRPGEDLDAVGTRCVLAAEQRGVTPEELEARNLELRPLAVTDRSPQPGETIACFVRNASGTALRGSVFSTGSDR